jgi:Peptidase inhibitor family I36
MLATGASAAPATAAHRASPAAASAPLAGAYTRCPAGDWCIFKGTNGTGALLAHSTSWPKTYEVAFRNKDESIANRTGGAVRFYYTLDYKDDWVCLNPGMYSNDVEPFAFNNGPENRNDGWGVSIWHEIASIGVTSGKCSNPLPLP